MKAEIKKFFMIPISQNYQGVPLTLNRGDASQLLSYFINLSQ